MSFSGVHVNALSMNAEPLAQTIDDRAEHLFIITFHIFFV